jgi:hypothetical protein
MHKNRSHAVIQNPLIALLSSTRLDNANIFSQELIFLFNRSTCPQESLLILGFLRRVFMDVGTDLPDLFYTNDLKSILDVLLRELLNGRDDNKEVFANH